MPLPICPAPTTPIFRIENGILSDRAFGLSLTSIMFIRLYLCGSQWPSDRLALFASRSTAKLAELGSELRQRLVEIGHEAVIGNLKDRCVRVLVDGHDNLGILHAGKMLDRARYADRNVEFGRDDLAGLAHLPVVRGVAGIDGSARGTHCRTQLVRHRLDVFCEILAALHRPSAGNDNLGRGELRALRFRQLLADEGGDAGV